MKSVREDTTGIKEGTFNIVLHKVFYLSPIIKKFILAINTGLQ